MARRAVPAKPAIHSQYQQYAATLRMFLQTNGAIAKLRAHLAAHSAQLAKNLSLANAYYHELLSMGQPASMNATAQQLFGSVLGDAEQLLLAAISQTQTIQAQFSPTAIETAVDDLAATLSQVSSLIDAEKQAITDVVTTLSMTTDAYTYPGLYENELCKPVMDVLASRTA
jgi:tRNA A22 N-methylase